MKLATLLALPATLLASAFVAASAPPGDYSEHLHLKTLPGGFLYAGFNFTATTSLSDYQNQHFRYFPRSLGQILQHSHTNELHLRFALGRWDEESWGSRPRDGRREGGTGVELWAWVEGGGEAEVVEERWSSLVNSLSGLFCASLNFIDGTKTTRPVLTFEPEGMHTNGNRNMQLLHGTLPHEVVCTENLTPFLKLLPCKGKAGISSLLDGHKVFDANWQTMSVDVRPACRLGTSHLPKAAPSNVTNGAYSVRTEVNSSTYSPDGYNVTHSTSDETYSQDGILQDNSTVTFDYMFAKDGTFLGPAEYAECDLEIQQTVDMVLDIERSMRPRDDPIPRPKPMEEIECDTSKHYNAEDTCYPNPREGEMGWSSSKIFGQPVKGSCHLDGSEHSYDISLEVPAERTVEISSEPKLESARTQDQTVRLYTLPKSQDFDISLPQQAINQRQSLPDPPLYASRQMTGYGAERGGMHATIRNPHPYPQTFTYFENLPWFLRPYMHTLKVEGARLEKMYYTPAIDRQRGTHLELLLEVPAESTVELTYDFEKAILRYTEYPPDANRGFDVAPAVIRVLPSNASVITDKQGSYLRTTSLLLPLPTPDFSMPYNVIILTSTVIALGFGSIFNLLVRRFVLVEEVPASAVVARIRERLLQLKATIQSRFGRAKASDPPDGDAKGAESTPDGLQQANGGPKSRGWEE